MTATIEVRKTPLNSAFTGYCIEFYMSDILLAAVCCGSPAYEALLKHYEEKSELEYTCVSRNSRGVYVKSKVAA